ncbi:MAG: tetratricopeptide repeat protein [Candidatus Acidiferrales bacterium]
MLAQGEQSVAEYREVVIHLRNPAVRGMVLAVCTLVAGIVCYSAGRCELANHHDHSSDPAEWLRAAQLEPGNGAYWEHLAAYREFDLEAADLNLSAEYFLKAIATNPRSPRYWVEIAGVYEGLGDNDKARAAYERARLLYPISAEVHWGYGNFLLRQGDFGGGFSEIHTAILGDPDLIPLAVSRCWQSKQDVGTLLDSMLPPSPNAYFQAIGYFVSIHLADPAIATWDRLVSLGKPIEIEQAFPLLDELCSEERTSDAQKIWRQALVAAKVLFDEPPDHSIVWNGGFERDFTGGGFDWRVGSVAGAVDDYDTGIYHSGSRSLRVDFGGGSNLDFWQIWQTVPVEPETRYHFRAFLKTDSISTESGMRFEIRDPRPGAQLRVLTNDLVGTHDWTPVETDFTTDRDTHLLEIRLRRLESRLFDNKLSGTVWVDDVSLTPAEMTSGANAP